MYSHIIQLLLRTFIHVYILLGEGDAACGLGGVYQQMGEYEKALQYHQLDLQLAEMTSNPVCQCK